MTEQTIPDPPEFVPPPDEVVSAIAEQMRGSRAEFTDEQKEWLRDYRERVRLADANAAEQRRPRSLDKSKQSDKLKRSRNVPPRNALPPDQRP